MAEIGLAASIIGVAAFGATVATTLYETADIMRNAKREISALAKHVTQFTAVLNHMGQVLKTEKTNCSKEVLRDIRKIKHSCKRTFREINSTVKARHFRRFNWLLKRTKAMELEARLDSQQSMLQCIIHTLTVSKLSQIDSRSKEGSEHITGLKMEIKLLKTFIMESYNSLTALRRAEQSTEAEARYQPMSGGSHPVVHHGYGDGSTYPICVSSAFESPIPLSQSPTSYASKSDDEGSKSDGGADDDDIDDANSTKSKDQSDPDDPAPKGDTSNADGLTSGISSMPRLSYNDSSDSSIHRESNLFLQMVPYRPGGLDPIRSDRLISDKQDHDRGTKSATEEATNSVRLLLDKWTTSGSAPVSNILDEEAAREKDEAELFNKRRASDHLYDRYRRSSSPGVEYNEEGFGPTHDTREYEYPPPFRDDQTRYRNPFYQQQDFWKPSIHSSQPPDRRFEGEVLAALRSTRGGIHYMKSNQFKQVHYVDHDPIYTCALVPPHLIPLNEDKALDTELSRGSIRREALDLLGYSYTETGTGNFSITGNLELGEIEELVRLSYQALDRNLRERSKTVIKERGWGENIDTMTRHRPGMRPNEPWVAPHHSPPRSRYWYGDDEYSRHRPYTGYESDLPDRSAPYQASPPRLRPHEHPSARRRARPTTIPQPIVSERQEQNATKTARPEVRFTLPQAGLSSGTADAAREARPNPAPTTPSTKTADELQAARQKLKQLTKRREEAEKAKDLATASDLLYYAIPDLEAKIEKILTQQREEQQQQSAAPASPSKKEGDGRSYRAEVETESENGDDDRYG